MEIHFQCNLADYDEALKARWSMKRTKILVVSVFAFILIAQMIAVNLGVRQGTAGVVIIIFCLTLSFGISVWQPRWIRKDFQSHPNFQREHTLRIDDEGLHWKTEVDQSDTRWIAYRGYQETRNLFLFYLGKRLVQVVPKRAMSDAELEELRGLLQAKLPANTKHPELVKKSASSTLA